MIKRFNIVNQPKLIDFTVMGLDDITSNFLNWSLQNRDNLEYLKDCKTLNIISNSAVLHFDHLSVIKRIDDVIKHERT